MIKQQAVPAQRISVQRQLADSIPPDLKEGSIQFMGKEDLLRLQRHFRLGDEWGVIAVPREWCRAGEKAGSGVYRLNVRLQKHARTNEDLEVGCTTLVRMVLLCFSSPSKSGNRGSTHLSIVSIRSHLANSWLPIVKAALEKPPREDGALLARLDKFALPFRSDYQLNRLSTELKRFSNYTSRGLWWDNVQEAPATKVETTNKKTKRVPRTELLTDPYKPLPDEFVLETGKRAVWVVQQIMPQALCVYEGLLKTVEAVDGNVATKRSKKYLDEIEWDLGEHGSLDLGPFPINLGVKKKQTVKWPPQNRNEIVALLRVCQTAAYFIVALSGGARASEILSDKTSCLRESRDGLPLKDGKTYKLSAMFEGEQRDWPMPTIALQAVCQQQELARLIDKSIGIDRTNEDSLAPLWRTISAKVGHGNALGSYYNEYLRELTDRISTSHLLDEQAFTNHRFRKTIARLVALALVAAPKILMDVFGHKDITMTMHYILTDKNLRAEINQIQKELLAMRVEKAIANFETNGGPAAKKIEAEVQRIRFVRAREDLQAEDIHETVVRMTSVGREWTIVAAGVLCTKMRDQVGPCAARRSTPNPSKCSSKCAFRLEEADNLNHVDELLAYIVKNLHAAQANNDILATDAYEGQLLANINRFDVLNVKWSKHPAVKPILDRLKEEVRHAA